jgi:hypothetical protein
MSGWTWLGVLAGLLAFFAISFSKTLFAPSWIAHALALAALAAAMAIIRYRRGPTDRGFAAGVVAVFSLGLALSVWSLYSVGSNAKDTAAGAPYCIQVTDTSRAGPYVSARSLLDLSGLTMWSRSFLHHAVLVVGDLAAPRLFHWSYRRQEFVPGIVGQTAGSYGTALACAPSVSFIASLPALFHRGSDSQYIRLSGEEAYRIPHAYQPRWGGSSGGFVSFAAMAPDFKPLGAPWSGLSLRERSEHSIFIEWNPSWLNGLLGPEKGQLAGQPTVFGLRTEVRVTQGKNGNSHETKYYRADASEQPGVNTTLIICYPASDVTPIASCQHRFLSGERHFNFRHRPEDLPRWQAMQKRLAELMDSFVVQ